MNPEGLSDPSYPQLGVSNSEVSSYLTCQRAWFYAHHPSMHIQPLNQGPALTRGIIGHEALEVFYKGLQAEDAYDDAAQRALKIVLDSIGNALLNEDYEKMKNLQGLHKLLEGYFEHYKGDIKHWEILGVEKFYAFQWDGIKDVYLPMRLDMVIYQREGAYKGETSPVDHKFTKDFWHQWKLDLNIQLPLYIRTLRGTRFKGKLPPVVNRSIVNMIRTGAGKDAGPYDIYKRAFIPAKKTSMELAFQNHLNVAKKISEVKRLPMCEAFQKTDAQWGSPNCQFCSFRNLCIVQLQGGDLETEITTNFKKSAYGYPSFQELKGEQ